MEALTPFPVKRTGLLVTHPANPSLFPWMDRPVSYLLSTADIKVTQKSFNFARKFSLPLYFVSAADGTNVVKVILVYSGQTASGEGQGNHKSRTGRGAGTGADRDPCEH